jgi:hypothetical protein
MPADRGYGHRRFRADLHRRGIRHASPADMLIAIADGHQGHLSSASKDVLGKAVPPYYKQLKLLDQTGLGSASST